MANRVQRSSHEKWIEAKTAKAQGAASESFHDQGEGQVLKARSKAALAGRGGSTSVCLFVIWLSPQLVSANDTRIDIGFLACRIGAGNPSGANDTTLQHDRELLCTFTPGAGGPEETYVAGFQSSALGRRAVEGARHDLGRQGSGSPAAFSGTVATDVCRPETLVAAGLAAPLTGQTNASIVLLDVTDASACWRQFEERRGRHSASRNPVGPKTRDPPQRSGLDRSPGCCNGEAQKALDVIWSTRRYNEEKPWPRIASISTALAQPTPAPSQPSKAIHGFQRRSRRMVGNFGCK